VIQVARVVREGVNSLKGLPEQFWRGNWQPGILLRLYVQSNLTKCEMATYLFLLGYGCASRIIRKC
jgi:hypothetical protein